MLSRHYCFIFMLPPLGAECIRFSVCPSSVRSPKYHLSTWTWVRWCIPSTVIMFCSPSYLLLKTPAGKPWNVFSITQTCTCTIEWGNSGCWRLTLHSCYCIKKKRKQHVRLQLMTSFCVFEIWYYIIQWRSISQITRRGKKKKYHIIKIIYTVEIKIYLPKWTTQYEEDRNQERKGKYAMQLAALQLRTNTLKTPVCRETFPGISRKTQERMACILACLTTVRTG